MLEVWIVSFEKKPLGQPLRDGVSVLPDKLCYIASSKAIAEDGKGDELDSPSNLIRLSISRGEIFESVTGNGLESGRELRKLDLEPFFGEPTPIEQRRCQVTTGIGDLINTAGRLPPRELIDLMMCPLSSGNRSDPTEIHLGTLHSWTDSDHVHLRTYIAPKSGSSTSQ